MILSSNKRQEEEETLSQCRPRTWHRNYRRHWRRNRTNCRNCPALSNPRTKKVSRIKIIYSRFKVSIRKSKGNYSRSRRRARVRIEVCRRIRRSSWIKLICLWLRSGNNSKRILTMCRNSMRLKLLKKVSKNNSRNWRQNLKGRTLTLNKKLSEWNWSWRMSRSLKMKHKVNWSKNNWRLYRFRIK